jgi:hypothetical protein
VIPFDVVVSIVESVERMGAGVLLLLPLVVTLDASMEAMGGWSLSAACHLRALGGGGSWWRDDWAGGGLSSSHAALTTTTSGHDFFWEGSRVKRGKRRGGREWRSRFRSGDCGGGYLSLTNDDIIEESLFVPSQGELLESDILSEISEGFDLIIKLSLGGGGAGKEVYETNLISP